MKAIFYNRIVRGWHIHGQIYTYCLYLPERQAMLYGEQSGTFGGMTYGVTRDEKMLAEAVKIMGGTRKIEGGESQVGEVQVFTVREVEIDAAKVDEIIKAADENARLTKIVVEGVDGLIGALKKIARDERYEQIQKDIKPGLGKIENTE